MNLAGYSDAKSTGVKHLLPDESFSTDGGMFELSVILRDEQGEVIIAGVTRENFAFRNITVSMESMPEDIVTNGRADVTEIEILPAGSGEQVNVVLDFDGSGSMLDNDPDRKRVDAGKQLVSLLKPTDQAAIMDFGKGASPGLRDSLLLQSFTSDRVWCTNRLAGLDARRIERYVLT